MTCLLNSMGRIPFNHVDQIDLSNNIDQAERQVRETPQGVLLLEGGEDVHPQLYGQQKTHADTSFVSMARDRRELKLIDFAIMYGVPIIGICRGHQLLAVSQGGTLYQDIQFDAHACHDEYHMVTCFDILKKYYGRHREVNSYHHQAVHRVPVNAVEIARADDGINEGLYYPTIRAVSVQWHPEFVDDFEFLNWTYSILGMDASEYVALVPSHRHWDYDRIEGAA